MALNKGTRTQMAKAKGDVVLPPWWKLASVVLGVVFLAYLLFSSLTSSAPEPSAAQVPAYALGGSRPAPQPSAKPADKPSAKPSAKPALSTPAAGSTDQTGATAAPREVTRTSSVLTMPLFDDGNSIDVTTKTSSALIPRNLYATAMAALYAQVDPTVAASLPVLGERTMPFKNWPRASIVGLTITDSTDSTTTFSATVDKDGAGPNKGSVVTVVVEDTANGYFVRGS